MSNPVCNITRIGDWHESETSRNYATGCIEAGVSVYDLTPDGGIVVPPDGEWSLDDLRSRLSERDTRYVVQGDRVGTGGDGEPVLRSIRIVGAWPDDLPPGLRSSVLDLDREEFVSSEQAKVWASPARTVALI